MSDIPAIEKCHAVVGGKPGDAGGTLSYCGQPEASSAHTSYGAAIHHDFVAPVERHLEEGDGDSRDHAGANAPVPSVESGSSLGASRRRASSILECCGVRTKIVDSRQVGGSMRRRRACGVCGVRFTTIEVRQVWRIEAKPGPTPALPYSIAAVRRYEAARQRVNPAARTIEGRDDSHPPPVLRAGCVLDHVPEPATVPPQSPSSSRCIFQCRPGQRRAVAERSRTREGRSQCLIPSSQPL